MKIALDDRLMYVICAILFAWALQRFVVLPWARRSVAAANARDVVTEGTRLGLHLSLAALLDTMVAAAAIVVVGLLTLQWYISYLPTGAPGIDAVTHLRDQLERVIDVVSTLSKEVWLVCLGLLGLTWLGVSRSSSRRRWDEAVTARRAALEKAIATVSGEELRKRAVDADGGGVSALDGRIEQLRKDNGGRIASLLSKKVLQVGDDQKNLASLGDLQGVVERMRSNADTLDGTAAADSDREQAQHLRETAAALSQKFDELVGKATLELRTLGGSNRLALLSAALTGADEIIGIDAARDEALRKLVVDAQLATHKALGASKSRSEPELIREWLAAGATSEASIKTQSFFGRSAGMAALIAWFVGFVGIGVEEFGQAVVAQATALQLQIAALNGQRDLTATLAKRDSEKPAPEPQPDQLASNDATVQALRQSFHASIAHALRANLTTQHGLSTSQAAAIARDHFDLGALEARQRILSASSRSAAPALETSQTTPTFRAFGETRAATAGRNEMVVLLDETVDRRIEVLRRNEGLWTRLRQSALRPAPADFVGDAFMHTAFGTNPMATTDTMRLWVDQASYQYSTHAVQTGTIPGASDVHYRLPDDHPLFTLRDQRLLGDYHAQAPERVANALDDVRTGRADPGSLRRELPGAPTGRPGSGGAYSELFPAASESGGAGGMSPSGGGPAGGGRSSGPAAARAESAAAARAAASAEARAIAAAERSAAMRVASSELGAVARVFGRIRFSPKIGGVLIGVAPTPGGEAPDVRQITWRLDGNMIALTLVDASGASSEFGPYPAAIVNAALAYAADGRVVTSTLPKPQSNSDDEIRINTRRILVHPAFEDTSFACPAIQVDRFVDAFTSVDAPSDDLTKIGEARQATELFAELLKVAAGVPTDIITRSNFGAVVGIVARYARSCGTGAQCFPIEPYAKLGFDYGGTAKFLNCVAEQQETSKCIDLLAQAPPSAGYLVDSGVREVPFQLDKSLRFLKGGTDSPLWPLDFMIQAVPVAFTKDSAPIGAAQEPWRFPTIDKGIKAVVAGGVANNVEARSVLDDMRAFTVLQRMFRLALSGDLGLSFPLDSLVGLQQQTSKFVKVVRSERWNVNRELEDLLEEQDDFLRKQAAAIAEDKASPAACKSAANAAVARTSDSDRSWPRSDGIWPLAAAIEKHCSAVPAARPFLRRLALLRRDDLVDEALHISRSASKGKQREFACAPL